MNCGAVAQHFPGTSPPPRSEASVGESTMCPREANTELTLDAGLTGYFKEVTQRHKELSKMNLLLLTVKHLQQSISV